MKRVWILLAAFALAPAAEAQLYKYVDKNGKTVYSDQPPPGQDSKTIKVQTGGGPETKSAVERDKERQKVRKAAADKEKKSAEAEKEAERAAARCKAARTNYQIYQGGGRIQTLNDKGERELLTDEQIEAKRVSSRREMEEACKS